jgi:hypothetical protein
VQQSGGFCSACRTLTEAEWRTAEGWLKVLNHRPALQETLAAFVHETSCRARRARSIDYLRGNRMSAP